MRVRFFLEQIKNERRNHPKRRTNLQGKIQPRNIRTTRGCVSGMPGNPGESPVQEPVGRRLLLPRGVQAAPVEGSAPWDPPPRRVGFACESSGRDFPKRRHGPIRALTTPARGSRDLLEHSMFGDQPFSSEAFFSRCPASSGRGLGGILPQRRRTAAGARSAVTPTAPAASSGHRNGPAGATQAQGPVNPPRGMGLVHRGFITAFFSVMRTGFA